jgi:microcystin-dependent protein
MSVSSAPDFLPVGSVFAYAGVNVPCGYLLCDGSQISQTTYWELYNAIGLTFNPTPSAGLFELPDFVNTYVSGTSQVTGVANSSSFSGGNVTATIGTNNIPSITFGSCGVVFGSTPYIQPSTGQQAEMITASSNSQPTGGGSNFDYFNFNTPTTTQVNINITSGQASYSGGGVPLSAPLISPSGSVTLTGIQLTYIIKAFNPLNNFPPPIPPPPISVSYLPPPNDIVSYIDIPNLSGFLSQ